MNVDMMGLSTEEKKMPDLSKRFVLYKSWTVTGKFLENETYFCNSPEMAREVLCTVVLQRRDAYRYFNEDQWRYFKDLIKWSKYKKAWRYWRSCGNDEDIRIEDSIQVTWKPEPVKPVSIKDYGLTKDVFKE